MVIELTHVLQKIAFKKEKTVPEKNITPSRLRKSQHLNPHNVLAIANESVHTPGELTKNIVYGDRGLLT